MNQMPDKFISITAMHKFTGHNDYKSVDGCIQIESDGLYGYYVHQKDGYYHLIMTSMKSLERD